MSEGTRRAAEAVHRRARRVQLDHNRPVERAVLRSLDPLICELFESSLQLKYLDDWRMTDEMRWYRATFGFDVGDELVLVEMHDNEWLAVGHFSNKDTPVLGGGTGILGAAGGLTYAVTNPGGLLARYQLGEPGGDPADTAGHPLGPFPLHLVEITGGIDPDGGSQATWDGSQAPTYGVPVSTPGDDGGVQFNYNQKHIVAGLTDGNYPGAYFADATSSLVVGPFEWGTSVGSMKSVGFFVKPSSAQVLDNQPIIGYTFFSDTNDGLNGWAFSWKRSTGELAWGVINGGGPPIRAFSLGRSGLAADVWYRVCGTFDPATNTWTLMINGVVVASIVRAFTDYFPAINGGIRINGLQGWAGNFSENTQSRGYGLFSINEVDIYTVVLKPIDEQRIIAAAGPGYGTTITTLSIGAGAPGSPGAISSGLATSGQKLTADGVGGTYWS